MKRPFANLWKRNLGLIRLGILSNIEYRLNFLTDMYFQPLAHAAIEVLLWIAVFKVAPNTVAGFSRDYYISYAIWAGFIARITTNWMYESRMVDEIDSGSVNSILVRPISFFEYYFSQFYGYKVMTAAVSLIVPISFEFFFHSHTDLRRLPLALAIVFYYLILSYILSFCVSALAFSFNRIHSLTTTKNFILWLLSGELFPLDLLPQPWRQILSFSPFSSGAYLPAGYLTGRLAIDAIFRGFISISYGIVFFGVIAMLLWKSGLKRYAGTGA